MTKRKKIVILFLILLVGFFVFVKKELHHISSNVVFNDATYPPKHLKDALIEKHYCSNIFKEIWYEFKNRKDDFQCPKASNASIFGNKNDVKLVD